MFSKALPVNVKRWDFFFPDFREIMKKDEDIFISFDFNKSLNNLIRSHKLSTCLIESALTTH